MARKVGRKGAPYIVYVEWDPSVVAFLADRVEIRGDYLVLYFREPIKGVVPHEPVPSNRVIVPSRRVIAAYRVAPPVPKELFDHRVVWLSAGCLLALLYLLTRKAPPVIAR